MRNGWMWVIPVQGRLGCGYVFDSRMTDEAACLAELGRHYPGAVTPSSTIRFSPGWYRRPWVNNCVAVGLASGFLEPLEATSIWFSVLTLNELFRRCLPLGDDAARDTFNDWFDTLMQRGADFVYLHYLGRRRDTPFWQTFRERTVTPDRVRAALHPSGWRNWMADEAGAAGNPLPFPWTSWLQIAGGTGNLDRGVVARYWDYYGLHDGEGTRRAEERARIEAAVDRCLDHEACLRRLGAPPG
jgi:tryptophan halogenase